MVRDGGKAGGRTGDLFPGERAPDPALSQWDTPPDVALAMARWALPSPPAPGVLVIEPSAGTGSLVRAALAAAVVVGVIAVEIESARADALRRRHSAAVRVVRGDWLEADEIEAQIAPSVESYAETAREWGEIGEVVILANPPYDGGADTRHLRACALMMERLRDRWGLRSRLVVLARTVIVHGAERQREVWSRVVPVGGRWTRGRVAFGGGGAGKIDVTAYECVLHDDPRREGLASRPDAWGWL